MPHAGDRSMRPSFGRDLNADGFNRSRHPSAAEIHDHIGSDWPALLEQLGIGPEYLQNRHGPCPSCGGKDRYRFDNKYSRGNFICAQCAPKGGDGFALLQRVFKWDFRTARARVMEAAGISHGTVVGPFSRPRSTAIPLSDRSEAPPQIPGRVLRLRRESCTLHDCDEAIRYLTSRSLWPAAAQSALRAHVGIDYFDQGQKVGRYPGLVAQVRDHEDELVTLHITYLDAGRKLQAHEPRKMLSPLNGRESCAVRLYPISGDSMGIGEGLETCIAAATIHEIPVWAALNTSLLAKFSPPAQIRRLIAFIDRDVAGLTAGTQLFERLQGKIRLELKTPPPPANDWADVLLQRGIA